ncbi:MAG: hypothetical protein EPO21_11055 [Chloroflexota bacterium]|nr:MAG: hypothetical protein EPO21_11055 [Chloroflexota bacterium]
MATPQLRLGKMENAPDWYGKSLDELHFEWSKEEELELERYCEKILKNAEEEEMTPLQRYEATWQGKEKDRLHIEVKYNVPYAVRTLDSFADAIKPGDLYKRPKLHIKGHLAAAARLKLDIINVYAISYTEELWGADGRMIDYGTPQQAGGPPIKTMEDIESVEVPDPKKDGLYPGYLWTVRELKRIMTKHGVDKVLPLEACFCGDPLGTAFMGMLGFGPGTVAVKKNPELFKACMDKATEWSIKFGSAVKELNPNGMYLCSFMGAFPPKMKNIDNEWVLDCHGRIGKAVGPNGEGKQPYLWHTLGSPGWELWMRLYAEHGALGPGSFGGWWVGPLQPHEQVFAYSREKDVYCGCSIDDHAVLDGDFPKIEELLAPRLKEAKLHPKHFCALGVIDYWTPQPVVDKLLELAKRLGRF